MATTISNTVAPSRDDQIPASLDITAPLPPYRAITGSIIEYIRPRNGLDHQGPYNFVLSPDNLRYLQTSFMRISGYLKIVNKDGSNLEADAKVAPLDYFGQTWISKYQVLINNNLVSEGSGCNYGIKSYINALVNYEDNAANCALRASGYSGIDNTSLATPAATDKVAASWEKIESYASLTKHKERFAGSKYVQFWSDLQIDMFKTNKEWPTGMQIEIRIFPQPDEFFIMADEGSPGDYKYQLKDLELQVRKIQPNQAVIAANEAAIAKSGAKYLFNNWTMNQHNMYKGQRIFSSPSLFRGVIPSKTIYVMIDTEAFNGNFKKNPTIFKHWDITKFNQRINGISAPLRPLTFDWDNENVSEAYGAMLDGCGIGCTNRGNQIKYSSFKQDKFILIFDNSCDGTNFYDNARDKISTGYVDVELEFKNPLEANVTLCAFGITDDNTLIDLNRVLHINPIE